MTPASLVGKPVGASPESSDELLAMINFEGTPAIQVIDIFDTADRNGSCHRTDSHTVVILLKNSKRYATKSGSLRNQGQPIGVRSIRFASPMGSSGSLSKLSSSTRKLAD
jgi:hypothetical protein